MHWQQSKSITECRLPGRGDGSSSAPQRLRSRDPADPSFPPPPPSLRKPLAPRTPRAANPSSLGDLLGPQRVVRRRLLVRIQLRRDLLDQLVPVVLEIAVVGGDLAVVNDPDL
jgi:hypothetical protein